jgi:hypothetical protein
LNGQLKNSTSLAGAYISALEMYVELDLIAVMQMVVEELFLWRPTGNCMY